MDEDPIIKFIQQSGLSYNQILKKLDSVKHVLPDEKVQENNSQKEVKTKTDDAGTREDTAKVSNNSSLDVGVNSSAVVDVEKNIGDCDTSANLSETEQENNISKSSSELEKSGVIPNLQQGNSAEENRIHDESERVESKTIGTKKEDKVLQEPSSSKAGEENEKNKSSGSTSDDTKHCKDLIKLKLPKDSRGEDECKTKNKHKNLNKEKSNTLDKERSHEGDSKGVENNNDEEIHESRGENKEKSEVDHEDKEESKTAGIKQSVEGKTKCGENHENEEKHESRGENKEKSEVDNEDKEESKAAGKKQSIESKTKRGENHENEEKHESRGENKEKSEVDNEDKEESKTAGKKQSIEGKTKRGENHENEEKHKSRGEHKEKSDIVKTICKEINKRRVENESEEKCKPESKGKSSTVKKETQVVKDHKNETTKVDITKDQNNKNTLEQLGKSKTEDNAAKSKQKKKDQKLKDFDKKRKDEDKKHKDEDKKRIEDDKIQEDEVLKSKEESMALKENDKKNQVNLVEKIKPVSSTSVPKGRRRSTGTEMNALKEQYPNKIKKIEDRVTKLVDMVLNELGKHKPIAQELKLCKSTDNEEKMTKKTEEKSVANSSETVVQENKTVKLIDTGEEPSINTEENKSINVDKRKSVEKLEEPQKSAEELKLKRTEDSIEKDGMVSEKTANNLPEKEINEVDETAELEGRKATDPKESSTKYERNSEVQNINIVAHLEEKEANKKDNKTEITCLNKEASVSAETSAKDREENNKSTRPEDKPTNKENSIGKSYSDKKCIKTDTQIELNITTFAGPEYEIVQESLPNQKDKVAQVAKSEEKEFKESVVKDVSVGLVRGISNEDTKLIKKMVPANNLKVVNKTLILQMNKAELKKLVGVNKFATRLIKLNNEVNKINGFSNLDQKIENSNLEATKVQEEFPLEALLKSKNKENEKPSPFKVPQFPSLDNRVVMNKLYVNKLGQKLVKKYKKLQHQKRRAAEVTPQQPIEDIRSKLKEQLELLRTRKKSTDSLELLPRKKPDITRPSLLAKRDSPDSLEVKEEPVVLSNESNLMIVSVVGGYTSPTHECESLKSLDEEVHIKEEIDDGLDKLPSEKDALVNSIVPTKTNDVTKIKGWKNKKFGKKPSDRILHQLTCENDYVPPPPVLLPHCPLSKPTSPFIDRDEKNIDGPTADLKSAFISDELDQYLTENSELKISYEVPKLEAETVKTNYAELAYVKQEEPQTARVQLATTEKLYKPKTLAEKRKMMVEGSAAEEFFGMKVSAENFQQHVLSVRNKFVSEKEPFRRTYFLSSTNITNTNSFVDYNGKMLKVPCKGESQVISKIKEKKKYRTLKAAQKKPEQAEKPPKPRTLKVPRYRKPSLLQDLKEDPPKDYDPSEWVQIERKVPKLFLEIIPEFGKRLHPKIEHLIQNDSVNLTPARVEFALSALQQPNPKKKIFLYPVPLLTKQTRVTMRRPILKVIPPIRPKSDESDEEVQNTVRNVINKMLDYVEVQEETKHLLRHDSSLDCFSNASSAESLSPIKQKKKEAKKKKVIQDERSVYKTTLEMRRLNCKIVSISMEEDKEEEKPCEQEYCRLGCICKSIGRSSGSLINDHCGLLRCMFKCKCKSKSQSKSVNDTISLPSGSDIFSEGVINRLQDEAKKDLAKVEKEFTHTIIKTNNKLIIVGESNDRRRRATRFPKKYMDFIDEVDRYKHIPIRRTPSITIEEPYVDPLTVIKPCYVKLLKYDFSDILPYCLVHNLYKCHCNFTAELYVEPISRSRTVPYKFKAKAAKPVKTSPSKPSFTTLTSPIQSNHSCRTKGLVTSYYILRNKSTEHRTVLLRTTRKLQKQLEGYLRSNAEKILENSEKDPSKQQASVAGQQQKQAIVSPTVDSDVSLVRMEPVAPSPIPPLLSVSQPSPPPPKKPQESIFNDSINLKSEFKSLLGNKYTQMRLMPWSMLATRFENESVQIWYSSMTSQSPLVITENNKKPSNHHCNIKLFAEAPSDSAMPSDIIHWLIKKQLPPGSPDDILLVLAYNKINWEICGICEKNKMNKNLINNLQAKKNQPKIPTPPVPARPVVVESPPIIDITESENTSLAQEQTTIEHENLQANRKLMYCSKRRFQPKKLICLDSSESSNKIRQVLWAPIPSVSMPCKWRVIFMNQDFAYLSLSRSSYTIKYNDIQKAMKMAQSEQVTIVLKSDELQKNYIHKNFGIYCVHNYADKIFVGPYYLEELHDLDTLSYINNILVNTTAFNKQKKVKSIEGAWFHQNGDEKVDDDVIVVPNPAPVVDLTCESDEEVVFDDKEDSETEAKEDDTDVVEDTIVIEDLLTDTTNKESSTKASNKSKTNDSDKSEMDDKATIIRLDHLLARTKATKEVVAQVTISSDEETSDSQVSVESCGKSGSKVNVLDLLKGNTSIGDILKGNVTIKEVVKAGSEVKTKESAKMIDVEEKLEESSQSEEEISVLREAYLASAALDRDTEKAEKVLDSLLKNNQINVNPVGDKSPNTQHETGHLEEKTVGVIMKKRYLMSNISGLGYITAYENVDTMTVDVVCPITKRIKRFINSETAITALERVFMNKFIRIPSNFQLKFRKLTKPEGPADLPLDRTVLCGYHIIGSFGVKNVLKCSATELEFLGLKKDQIKTLWMKFEHKLLWPAITQLSKLLIVAVTENDLDKSLVTILESTETEIAALNQEEISFGQEKLELFMKRAPLVDQYKKLVEQLPPAQQLLAKKDFDRIMKLTKLHPPPILAQPQQQSPSVKPQSLLKSQEESSLLKKRLATPPVVAMKRKLESIDAKTLLSFGNEKYVLVKKPKGAGAQPQVMRKVKQLQGPNSFVTFKLAPSTTNLTIVGASPSTTTTAASGIATTNLDLSKCTFEINPHDKKIVVKPLKRSFGGIPVKTVAATTVPSLVVPTSSVVTNANVTTSRPVPDLIKATPSSSLATLTPITSAKPALMLKNKTALPPPPYIAIKDSDGFKYFQLLPGENIAIPAPLPFTNNEPPAKKVALSSEPK